MALSFLCRSFAYLTVKDRLPTILTKVIDTIHRSKDKIFEEYGEVRIITDEQNLSDLKPVLLVFASSQHSNGKCRA